MKILLLIDTWDRLDGAMPLSGSERQLLGTADALAALGHDVQVINLFDDLLPYAQLQQFDIVHAFNAGGPKGAYLNAFEVLKRHYGKRIVFSPIYWPPDELAAAKDQHKLTIDVDHIRRMQSLMVQSADFLLPNAAIERARMIADLGGSGADKPYRVVYNAIDTAEIDTVIDRPFPTQEDFILCVGRIECRKNQLGLIKALALLLSQGIRYPLLLIGAPDAFYANLCTQELQASGVKVASLGPCTSRMVYWAMRHCRAYVQPSYYETPGLASLEAAALGCALVTGNRGSEREYFQDYAYYCDPTEPESIAEAIRTAWKQGPHPRLKEHVRQNFTYERAVRETLKAYKTVLGDSC